MVFDKTGTLTDNQLEVADTKLYGSTDGMNIIFILIPLGLLISVVAVAAFFWAVRSGQYDDLESPGWNILFDDDRAPPESAAPRPETADLPENH